MSIRETETIAAAPPSADAFKFRVSDVTGTLEMDVTDLQANAPAGSAARAIAHRMELPSNVPWALRDDRGAFLDEEREIGEQIKSDARVTLVPKTHLG